MRRLSATILMASCLLMPGTAQESAGHLNPVIARLAAGKTVYGLINTGDLSLAHARDTARAPVDFVYADMEHSPLDFPGLAAFLFGALFLGAGSDLSRSMGVPANSPEVEAAFQRVLTACRTHKVACGITAGTANDIVRRVKEGWRIIRSTVPAITDGRAQLGDR